MNFWVSSVIALLIVGCSQTSAPKLAAGGAYSPIRVTNIDAKEANLEKIDLSGSHFVGGSFEGARLNNSTLWRARFEGVDFSRADFRGADLRFTRFDDCRLDGARFDDALVWGHRIEEGSR